MKTHLRRISRLLVIILISSSLTTHAQQVSTSPSEQIYVAPGFPVVIDPNITLTSLADINDMSVSIVENYQSGDLLGCFAILPPQITMTFDAESGQLFFKGAASAAVYQGILRQVNFQTTSTSNADRKIAFSIGKIVAGFNGHYYEFVPGYQTWKDAKALAQTRSFNGLLGYLATITSQEENDVIFEKLSASGWIGASDDYLEINKTPISPKYDQQEPTKKKTGSEASWHWVTGPEAGTKFTNAKKEDGDYIAVPIPGVYSNWEVGEPNDHNDLEHYGEIYSGNSQAGAAGKWNDFFNDNNDPKFIAGYVVEYGGIPDPNGANLTVSMKTMIVLNGLLTEKPAIPGITRPADSAVNILNVSNPITGNLLQLYYNAEKRGRLNLILVSGSGNIITRLGYVVEKGNNRFSIQIPATGPGIIYLHASDENRKRITTLKLMHTN